MIKININQECASLMKLFPDEVTIQFDSNKTRIEIMQDVFIIQETVPYFLISRISHWRLENQTLTFYTHEYDRV